MCYCNPLPPPSILPLRYCALDSTYPKRKERSGLCRENTSKKDAARSGSLSVCAAATSMAIAAGGLRLVERDRLGFLRQENKASWRKVGPHRPCPASSPPPAAAASWAHSVADRAGPCRGSVAAGLPGSLQLRTCTSCGTTLTSAVWPRAGGLGEAGKPQSPPERKFSASWWLPYPLPTPQSGMSVRAVGCCLPRG